MGIRRPTSRPGSINRLAARYLRAFRKWLDRERRRKRDDYRYGPQHPSLFNAICNRIGIKRPQKVLRIRFDNLARTHVRICQQISNEQEQTLALASAVIRMILGEAWFDKYVMPKGRKNIFTVDESNNLSTEHSLIKLIDFAEMLYNLQDAPGYDHCINRMREGNIEGTLAELDMGKLLYINYVPFRFVIPSGNRKSDYDIEILYSNGIEACADAKCKIDTTEFSESGIRNVLKEARDQLPNNRPGIIFVKVPRRWLDNPDFDRVATQCAQRLLGGTDRIVSVKYYTFELTFDNSRLEVTHLTAEFSNERTKFGDNIDWQLFHPRNPRSPLGMPKHWQRIFYFPDGIRKDGR